MAFSLLTSTTAKLSTYSLEAKFSKTQTDTHIQRKWTHFLRQIIKLQLHSAACVMLFPMLRVISQDWRIIKLLHSLGHYAVKIIGETLMNLPCNQPKSEQNNYTSQKERGKRTSRIFSGRERQKANTLEEMSKLPVSKHPWPTCHAMRLKHKDHPRFAWHYILAADAFMSIKLPRWI